MSFIYLDVFLDAAQHSQFGFYAHAKGISVEAELGMLGGVDHTLCNRNVFLKRFMTGVDHDRAVKPGVDAVITGFFVSVIQMYSENCTRKHLFGGANHRLGHAFVGIFSGALGELDDERRPALDIAAKEAE